MTDAEKPKYNWIDCIETKPIGGISVLLFLPAVGYQHPSRIVLGYYDVRGNTFWDWVEGDVVYPSHWTPLPEPPEGRNDG